MRSSPRVDLPSSPPPCDGVTSRRRSAPLLKLTSGRRRAIIAGEQTAKYMDSPRLFDSPPSPPTTRTIALTVKAGGSAALDQAKLRADAARYQEITCRSALNPVKGMPFNWTLNPYRGCTHGCHYCFARRYHAQFEMDSGDEFATVILVKQNIAAVLARELDRPSWQRDYVAFGTAPDPYQSIEGHYRLSRALIEGLTRGRTPFGLITKGPMVVRDIDVLLAHARAA